MFGLLSFAGALRGSPRACAKRQGAWTGVAACKDLFMETVSVKWLKSDIDIRRGGI